MPQTPSATKELRKSIRRRAVNDRWRKLWRSSVKAVRAAITAGEAAKAHELFPTAQRALDRAARRHVIHRNTAARTKSRLRHAIAKLPK